MPPDGRTRSFTEKTSSTTMPSQNVGTDTPSMVMLPIRRCSAGRVVAARTPTGMATALAITSEASTSWSVASSRSPRMPPTGRAYLYEIPQFPVSMAPSHFTYWTG